MKKSDSGDSEPQRDSPPRTPIAPSPIGIIKGGTIGQRMRETQPEGEPREEADEPSPEEGPSPAEPERQPSTVETTESPSPSRGPVSRTPSPAMSPERPPAGDRTEPAGGLAGPAQGSVAFRADPAVPAPQEAKTLQHLLAILGLLPRGPILLLAGTLLLLGMLGGIVVGELLAESHHPATSPPLPQMSDAAMAAIDAGFVARETDDHVAALAHFRTALELEPEFPGLPILVGQAALRADELELAREMARRGLQDPGTASDALALLGTAELRGRNRPGVGIRDPEAAAVEALQRAIRAAPWEPAPRMLLGNILRAQGERRAGIDLLDSARLRFEPVDSRLLVPVQLRLARAAQGTEGAPTPESLPGDPTANAFAAARELLLKGDRAGAHALLEPVKPWMSDQEFMILINDPALGEALTFPETE